MTQEMAIYCAAVKQSVVELMTAAFDMRSDPSKAPEVIALVDQILEAESLRPTPLLPAEVAWANHGVSTLNRLRTLAGEGDGEQLWAAFTDQVSGLYLLGNACQGQPGW